MSLKGGRIKESGVTSATLSARIVSRVGAFGSARSQWVTDESGLEVADNNCILRILRRNRVSIVAPPMINVHFAQRRLR